MCGRPSAFPVVILSSRWRGSASPTCSEWGTQLPERQSLSAYQAAKPLANPKMMACHIDRQPLKLTLAIGLLTFLSVVSLQPRPQPVDAQPTRAATPTIEEDLSQGQQP